MKKPQIGDAVPTPAKPLISGQVIFPPKSGPVVWGVDGRRRTLKLPECVKLLSAVRATNDISGRGEVVALVFRTDNPRLGVAVRQMDTSMDSVEFEILPDGKCVRFLQKVRFIL